MVTSSARSRLLSLTFSALIAGLWLGPAVGRAAPARIAALVASADADGKELADNLTEVLIAALARQSDASGIVGQEEFRAQLGQSDRGVLGCVGEPRCLARVGQALKVDMVLVAQVSRSVGAEYLVNANAIDVASGKVLRTLLRRPRGQQALIATVRSLARDLLRPATAALKVEINVEGDIFVDDRLVGRGRMIDIRDIQAGSHRVRVTAPGKIDFNGSVELAPDESRTLGVTLTAEVRPGRPFYKTWWFWTTIGAVAAGGAATAIVLKTRPAEPPTPTIGTIPFTGGLR